MQMIHSADQVKSAYLPGDYAIGVRCRIRAWFAHDERNLTLTTIFFKILRSNHVVHGI